MQRDAVDPQVTSQQQPTPRVSDGFSPASVQALIEEAERLLKDITPGEWHAPGLGEVHSDHDAGIYARTVSGSVIDEHDPVIADGCNDADAEFIAAAPRVIRSLSSALASLALVPHPQEDEQKKEQATRVEPMGDGHDSPTAASNEAMRAALEDMCYQFAHGGSRRGWPTLHTGGLSALEGAFEALGWDDPYRIPDPVWCDAPVTPRCPNATTSGTPTPDGYKRFCHDHFGHWQAAQSPATREAGSLGSVSGVNDGGTKHPHQLGDEAQPQAEIQRVIVEQRYVQGVVEKLLYRANRLNAKWQTLDASLAGDCVGIMRDAADLLQGGSAPAPQDGQHEKES